jgi:Tfp pilus assembly protein PilV
MKQHFTKPRTRLALCPVAGARVRLDETSSQPAGELGFSLLEAVISLLLMTIVALASASLFIYNNSGASDRATSIALAQEALELSRGARFNSTGTDTSLVGGTTSQLGIVRGSRTFDVTKTIDDDPSTNGVQINAASNFKTITITVAPRLTGKGWVRGAGGTITLITQRSRTDH